MHPKLDPILILFPFLLITPSIAQFTSQTYPDPRLDPFSCRLALPSQVCDPSAIVSDEERSRLVQRVNQLHSLTSGIKNTSPSCALMPDRNLEIIVAIIDKIGSVPGVPIDIEKFANNLKRRYQNFQDVGMCDTTVLIVNSRQDRQVFTVAGRDAKISKDTLKSAFERNIGHFKTGRYALGLEGMIEVIVAAYSNAHIVQVPTPEAFRPTDFMPSGPSAVSAVESQPFRAAGLPNSVQPAKRPFPAFNSIQETVDEDDKVWVSILQQAMARCGQNDADLPKHVRAVVEEAMNISLKLISDSRYNKIEEETEANKEVLGSRQKAWDSATAEFIRPLLQKYRNSVLSGATQTCPQPTVFLVAESPKKVVEEVLREPLDDQPGCCDAFLGLLRACGLMCYVACPPVPSVITRKLAFHPPEKGMTYRIAVKSDPEKRFKNIRGCRDEPMQLVVRNMSNGADYVHSEREVEVFSVTTANNNELVCIKCTPDTYSANPAVAEQVVLFCQPNSSDLGGFLQPNSMNFVTYANVFETDFYAFDYSGYGFSSGTQGEKNVYADIRAVYDKIRETRPDKKIVVMGYSIGTTAAVDLASRNLTNQTLAGQTLLLDEVIPLAHGMALYEKLKNPVPPLIVHGANHHTILSGKYIHVFTRIAGFLRHETLVSSRSMEVESQQQSQNTSSKKTTESQE
ncbi:hypothetical protein L3Y34_018910 [Caenorhabditis briggsae]|uniref:Serine aminopeptidase S33 domain-containing protein n=1 Tax=Caenorhabditis briggsae TaxID=6238 RepID=A0AAE9IVA9_CAEBR|nr:hypothetical protein L3Y34_018910 [Caenorhabditis briggsae]